MSDKEKEILEPTLQLVATMNPKNNQFDLLNEVMLNEVKEDWPAYNQNDKQIVKRNIAKCKQNLSFGSNSMNTSLNSCSNTSRPASSLSSSFTNPPPKPTSAFSSISSSNIKDEPKFTNDKKISPVKNENKTFSNGYNSNNFKNKFSISPDSDLAENLDLMPSKKPIDIDFDPTAKRLKPNGIKPSEPVVKIEPNNDQNEFSK